MKAYTVRGTSTDVTTCDNCGRSDLRSTVALDPAVGGEVVYFGVDCAARAAGWTVDETRARVRGADAEKRAAEAAQQAHRASEAFARWAAWLRERTGEVDVTQAIAALGGFAEARREFREIGG